MNVEIIVANLKKLFGTATSPGQAFDAIVAMRSAGVTWDDARKAVTAHGEPERPVWQPALTPGKPGRLDENDDGAGGVSTQRDSQVRNPKLGFGPYTGKDLSEVAEIDPDYVQVLAATGAPFWKKQALLALDAVKAAAPPSRRKLAPLPLKPGQ